MYSCCIREAHSGSKCSVNSRLIHHQINREMFISIICILFFFIYNYRSWESNSLTILGLGIGSSTKNFLTPHPCETRQRSDFMLPFPRTQCIRESFQYQILDCWIKLDSEIRNLDSLSAFKKACHQLYLHFAAILINYLCLYLTHCYNTVITVFFLPIGSGHL